MHYFKYSNASVALEHKHCDRKHLTQLQAAWLEQQTAVQDAAGVSGRREDVSQRVSLSEGLQGSTNQDVGVTSRSRLKKDKHATALPPWRDSDRCPKDIVRFNYLDNSDPVGQTSAA